MPVRWIVVCLAVLTLGSCTPLSAQTQRIGLLDGPLEVSLELPNFHVHMDGVRSDGRRYYYASNRETGLNLSVTLERAGGEAQMESCRSVLERTAQSEGPVKRDIKISEAPGRMMLEYTLDLATEGMQFKQRFFRVCIPHQTTYVDLSFSKVQFRPGDEELFQKVLATLQLANRSPGDLESWENWKKGSMAFRSREYKASIPPYRKALELEKTNRMLPRDFWRVLVDNLGMAYGISGDLKSAKEVFEYGLSQEATYPLFHYNLACTFAEMEDMANTMSALTRAFDLKENLISGEEMPDPRKDDSFQRFMKNKEFKQLADKLMKPQ